MKTQGVITSWNDDKGFGFISSKKHEKIFVHIKAFEHINKRPKLNQKVSFTLVKDSKNRFKALNVKIKQINFSIFFALSFFALLGILVLTSFLPMWLLSTYAAISFITFLTYWKDKRSAKRDQWRTPEDTLHLLSLIGGWPGALIAQQTLRHKSAKKSFKFVLYTTIVANLIFLLLIFTSIGESLLENISQYLK